MREIRIGRDDAPRPGTMKCIEAEGMRLLLANVDGRYFAADQMCTHEDAPLCTGSLKGSLVKCPLHGSRFDLTDGRVLDDPAEENLKVYPVVVRDDGLCIEVE